MEPIGRAVDRVIARLRAEQAARLADPHYTPPPPEPVLPPQPGRSETQYRYDSFSSLPKPLRDVPCPSVAPREGQEHLYAQIEQFLLKPRRFLVLVGPVGGGKSHYALYAAKHLQDSFRNVLWFDAAALLDTIRRSFRSDDLYEQQVRRSVERADVLVIDDYGAEKETDWSVATLHQVIGTTRYLGEQVLTILTTNLGWDALDERDCSRLLDREQAYAAYCSPQDFRIDSPRPPDDQRLRGQYTSYRGATVLCSLCGCRPHSPLCTKRVARPQGA